MSNMYQRQFDFNSVWKWFVDWQKPQAVQTTDYGSRCLYSTDDGRRCAYGVCLSENERGEVIRLRMNSGLASNVIETLKIKRHQGDVKFYVELQRCHDWRKDDMEGSHSGLWLKDEPEDFTKRMELRLRAFAKVYELTVPAPIGVISPKRAVT